MKTFLSAYCCVFISSDTTCKHFWQWIIVNKVYTEVDGVGSWVKTVGDADFASVDLLEELASFNWKSLNRVGSVAGCMFKRTAGSCALSSKSSNMGYSKLGDNRGLHTRSSPRWNSTTSCSYVTM